MRVRKENQEFTVRKYKTSVVLTTYNGDKYIIELLDSLRCQTRKPDEVIIRDDCSSDKTVELIRSYIENYNLEESWVLHTNKSNLGYKRNFIKCMKEAAGEIIFLCDQDDVWATEKVEIMSGVFERKAYIDALVCKERRIDSEGNELASCKTPKNCLKKIEFVQEIRELKGAGHLLALKKEFMDSCINHIEEEEQTFDIPFCLYASLNQSFYELSDILVNRRIHADNASGIKATNMAQFNSRIRYLEGRKCRLKYLKFICCEADKKLEEKQYKRLIQAADILEASYTGLINHRLKPIVYELLSNNPYLNKKISFANLLVYLKVIGRD